MTAHRLRFREKHDTKGETKSPCDLDGENLVDIFESYCSSVLGEIIQVKGTGSVVMVSDMDLSRRNAVIVSVYCGKTGEPEKVFLPSRGVQTYSITEEEAPMSYTRAVLMVPPRGETALFFTEQCARSRGAGILLRLFDTYFRHYSNTVYLDNVPIQEGRAWVEAAKALKKVEVQVYKKSGDRAERESEEDYYYSFAKFAKKNKTFGPTTLRKILDDPDFADSIVGLKGADIADGEVIKKVKLKVVGRDGRSKEYRVGSSYGGATIREVLNGDEIIMLDNDELFMRCMESAIDVSAQLRIEWSEDWFRKR